MTETPTTAPEILDEDLEIVSMAGRILGGIQGRWEAATAAFNASYRNAAHEEIQAAGVCDCPDSDEDAARADAEQLLAEVGKALAAMPKVVVLCGSTRFYDAFQQANYDETMAGNIVLSVGFYPHSKAIHGHGEGVGHDSAEKVKLDELHLRKIDLADEVLVLNVGGYVGESTRREIDYAITRGGKVIRWLEPGREDTPEALAERMDSIRQTDETETPLADQLPASADDENHEATPANLAAA